MTDDNGDEAARPTLIESQLVPPRLGDVIPRPRIGKVLDQALDGAIVLVTGEPAAGKTTGVLDWTTSERVDGRPIAWFTVPPAPDENTRFWWYLLGVADRIGIATADLRAALADEPDPSEVWLTTLANRFGQIVPGPVLVLDDLHCVEARTVLDGLRLLLDRLSPEVACVLVSRQNPPWSLSAWQMSGRLAEVRADDLRFRFDEALELLGALDGVRLDDRDVERLVDRTEGWAGGIKLAALTVQRVDDAAGFIDAFTADDELVSSYLFREVLLRQETEVRDFLLEVSILDELTADLCDELRDRDDSAAFLDRCRREHLFLVALDTRATTFRLHSLFAELLRSRLALDSPRRAAALHSRASEILERRGDMRAAIGHAQEAGDGLRAGRLLAAHATHVAQGGHFDELRAVLPLLHGHPVTDDPLRTVGLVLALTASGEPAAAIEIAEELTRADLAEYESYAAEQARGFALLAGSRIERLPDVIRALVRSPQEERPLPFEPHRLRAFFSGSLRMYLGDVSGARADFEAATAVEAQPDLFHASSPGWAAVNAAALGELDAALDLADLSVRRQAQLRTGQTAVVVPALLARADVAWERFDLAACADLLDLARRSVRPLVWITPLVELRAVRMEAPDDLAAAVARFDETAQAYLTEQTPRSVRLLFAVNGVDLALRVGESDRTERSVRFAAAEEAVLPAATRLRLALAAGGDADALAEELCALDEPTPARVDTLLAASAVALAAGDAARAAERVAAAARLGTEAGLVQRFRVAGDDVVQLVREMATDRSADLPPATRRLLEAVLGTSGTAVVGRIAPSAADAVPVEALTARELEVVARLGDGLSYTEIGAALFVSRNTVKSHVRHIYTKLGVASRAEAVAEAIRLGLL